MPLLFNKHERITIRHYYTNKPKGKRTWAVDRFEFAKALRDLKRDVRNEYNNYAVAISDLFGPSRKDKERMQKVKKALGNLFLSFFEWLTLIIALAVGLLLINLFSMIS